MYKKLFSVILFVFLLFFIVSCTSATITSQGEEPSEPTPAPGTPSPSIHVNGRIYSASKSEWWGTAQELLDDTYTYIGEVPSYVFLLFNSTEDLQGNRADFVGARLYHSGDNLIANINGVYSLFRFQGEFVMNWVNRE
jgi:hypothetical protein